MALLVSECLNAARVYLNDQSATVHTDVLLLPFFKNIYKALENRLRRSGYPYTKSVYTATVTAGSTTLPAQPVDLFQPVEMFERPVGGTEDDYLPMQEVRWDPNLTQVNELQYWKWQQLVVSMLGATSTREIKLRYLSVFPTITLITNNVVVLDALPYFAHRIAAEVAKDVMKDHARADHHLAEADACLDDILAMIIQKNQSLPVSRLPYRGLNRRVWQR